VELLATPDIKQSTSSQTIYRANLDTDEADTSAGEGPISPSDFIANDETWLQRALRLNGRRRPSLPSSAGRL